MGDVAALGAFFRPQSVAVIGASSDPKKPGNIALKNMLAMGFKGRVFPINPREETVLGLPCYRSVLEIPEPVELGILLVSPELTLQVAAELAERKSRFHDVRAAVCMTAGFGELNTGEARQREQELIRILRSAAIRLIGPNCLGIIDTESGVNTNFDIATYPRGGISFLTQSGAFGNSFLMWAAAGSLAGLSKFVSVGNMADVDMAELLMFLKSENSTKVIGIYLEGLPEPRVFFEVAREVAAVKPIVVLKAGKSAAGSTAALSHTGAVAGADALYAGAFRQAGMIRAKSVPEFYETLSVFEKQPRPQGNRVSVLTHMGGPGTICVDEISALPDLQMARFSAGSARALRGLLSPAANVGRPEGYVDMTAAHTENLHNRVLAVLFEDENVDLVIQILGPSAFLDQKLLAKEIAGAYEAQSGRKKPLLNVVTFGQFAQELKRRLQEAGLPVSDYPDIAARVAAHLARYAAHRRPAGLPGRKRNGRQGEVHAIGTPAARLINGACREGRISLLEPEAYEVCRQYGISVPPYEVADTPEDAIRAANAIGYPVALKVVASEILHKTDVGGVILGVSSDPILEQSYGRLVANALTASPGIRQLRVLVQKMMPATIELVMGAVRDQSFGPAVMFGLGGIYIEALRRVAFRLSPLSVEEAKAMIHETLPAAVTGGSRNRMKMNVDAMASALVSLGNLLEEQPQIEQVDLNPLLPYGDGYRAVDARIILSKNTGLAQRVEDAANQ